MNAKATIDAPPGDEPPFTVALVDWHDYAALLAGVRRRVFVEEQRVPEELEWDGLDPDCIHAAAVAADGAVIGTGRLLPDGRIGRMAVLAPWRGRGVGRAILGCLLACALQRGDRAIHLHAQVTALGFYAAAGFVATGDAFDDAGIAHLTMVYAPAAVAATSTRQS